VTTVVIPCAGYGSRFSLGGYTTPKPLVKVLDKEILHYCMVGVVSTLGTKIKVLSPTREAIQPAISAAIEKISKELSLELSPETPSVGDKTDGPATTVMLALADQSKSEDSLYVFDSDTYVTFDENDIQWSESVDCYVLINFSSHPQHSYVEVDSNGFVTDLWEKERKSVLAVTGCYVFKSVKIFSKLYDLAISKRTADSAEFFLSDLIKESVKLGQCKAIPVSSSISMGTPEELHLNVENLQKTLTSSSESYQSIKQLFGGSGDSVTLVKSKNGAQSVKKVAWGDRSYRLKNQFNYMRKYKEEFNFPEVFDEYSSDNYFSYKNSYLYNYVPLAEHLKKKNMSRDELSYFWENVFDFFDSAWGSPNPSSLSALDKMKLIKTKVDAATEFMMREYPEIDLSKQYRVNDVTCCSYYDICSYIFTNYEKFFKDIDVQQIHGDSTFSNIFIKNSFDSFEISMIDPNPENPYCSRAVDMGKLIQSSYGCYDQIFDTAENIIFDSEKIEFNFSGKPLCDLNGDVLSSLILDRYGINELDAARAQGVLHYIRLMPYRVKNNKSKAAAFFGMLLLMGTSMMLQDLKEN